MDCELGIVFLVISISGKLVELFSYVELLTDFSLKNAGYNACNYLRLYVKIIFNEFIL